MTYVLRDYVLLYTHYCHIFAVACCFPTSILLDNFSLNRGFFNWHGHGVGLGILSLDAMTERSDECEPRPISLCEYLVASGARGDEDLAWPG